MKKDQNHDSTSLLTSPKQSKGTKIPGTKSKRLVHISIDMDTKEKHCLWINQDSGEINVIPLSTPIEKVPLGFYVPHHVGTKNQMEQRKRQIILRRIKPKNKKILV